MRSFREHSWVWLVIFTSLVLFPTLGATRLWDRDEPRNAGCAVEMMARGDWVTPVFNAELRAHKPVLLYWCMMVAYKVLGISEFSARLSSALFAIGSVLCTYGIGNRLAGQQAGLLSGLILATTLMFGVAARAATPDAPLIFFTTLALWLLVRGVVPVQTADGATRGAGQNDSTAWNGSRTPVYPFPSSWAFRAAFYGALGLGVLAKGPVGLVLPLAVAGCFLLLADLPAVSERRSIRARLTHHALHFGATAWSMRPLTGLAIVLAVAAPWYLWVGYRTEGQWLREFFLEHNLNRARRPMEGHSGPPFYYLLALLPGFFPWSIFFLPTLLEGWHRLRRGGRDRIAVVFCASWLAVWIGAFSLASTKLPSYITPCYPALAVLTSMYLVRWIRCQEVVSPVWPWLSLLSLLLAGLAMALALPLVAARYLPGEQWLGLIGVIPLAAAVYGAYWYGQQQRVRVVRAVAVASALLAVGLFGVAAARVDRHQQSDRMLAAIERASTTPRVAFLGTLEPSWVYYAGRALEPVAVEPADPDSDHAHPEIPRWDEFLAAGPDRFVITTRGQLEQIGERAGAYEVLTEIPYFLKNERLVVLRGQALAAAPRPTAAR